MSMHHLPFDAPLASYQAQAETLLAAHAAGDEAALRIIHHCHPRFLDAKVPWMPLHLTAEDIRRAPFDSDDARLTVARGYNFLDWPALAAYAAAVADRATAVYRFEAAVEAVISGNEAALRQAIAEDPAIVHARSTRVTHFDPAVHRSTLLHYVAANGVENHRQRTPANAGTILRILLEAGADPNSLAGLYGGKCTTLSLLVSSGHPAEAGLQEQLTELLIDAGASVEPLGSGRWTSPVLTALLFGYAKTAALLVRRGATVDSLPAAAGLGLVEEVDARLPAASEGDRHRALALAAQLGHASIVARLLEAGVDPDRFNPDGFHHHATPLHHAALYGHEAAVKAMVERGARVDIADRVHRSTPAGWAEYGGYPEIAAFLRAHERAPGAL
ncbi:MAG TPA: hypothetical protein DEH78_13645 [Solibacterales bacterium]|nr:hypothetical protein [Bryobacterales bacterium]